MLALPTEKAESPKGLLSNLLGLKTGVKGVQDDKFSLLLKSFSLGKPDGKEFLFADVDAVVTTDPKDTKKLDPLLLLETKELKNTKNITEVITQEPEKALPKSLISLLSLVKEGASDEEHIHPDILKAIPLKDNKQSVQTLIGEAKSYLKEQILQKIDVVDVKELPKTLGGLIKLAEKSGIDVKAIRFDDLPKASFSKELTQTLSLVKVAEPLPHSTIQLVKPTPIKTEKENIQKPLNALLSKNKEIATPSIPVVEVLEEEVIKPTKTLPASITALLHGDASSSESSEGELTSKLDVVKDHEKPQSVNQIKTEALAQKITEAKQLVTHVSQNVKESLENYKPPFTRIKMQLNPQKFGDMEVTLIQRGSNVHININASSTALTVMMQNAHELKAQLSAQGLGDASMNFSSQQQEQHEQKQKREEAGLAYEEFQEYEEEFTEVATALEIVVPRYI